jgi:hypothetical protein
MEQRAESMLQRAERRRKVKGSESLLFSRAE